VPDRGGGGAAGGTLAPRLASNVGESVADAGCRYLRADGELTACSDREARNFTVADGRDVVSEATPGDVVKCASGGGATVPPPGKA
jgi:hypothetical protein